jgi:tRNA(Arg) A34 adenosine deaminase TadA
MAALAATGEVAVKTAKARAAGAGTAGSKNAGSKAAKPARTPRELMAEAIALSSRGLKGGRGGPFGAVVARDGKVIGRGQNRVLADSDPTAHAEVVALRDACRRLGRFHLDGCVLYTSCEPCPMCLAAAYWARVDAIVFANARADAAAIGFGDAFLYDEIMRPPRRRELPMTRLMAKEAKAAFRAWAAWDRKTHYGPPAGFPRTRSTRPTHPKESIPKE